jgi:Type IV secretion-system coupling protein DNA-binding domain
MDNSQHRDNEITPLGITNWRNVKKKFGIKDADRLRHIYCIGKTGVGKSTLLQNMVISDIERGKGVAIVDPHGDIAEDLLNYIPEKRIEDVIYFNPADTEHSIAFNPLSNINPEQFHLAASGLISTFKKIWEESWGPRLEHLLRFSLLTLLEYRQATLLDIQPLLTNPLFRSKVIAHITSSHLLAFWHNEFERYSPALKAEATAPILNKLGLFQASIPLRNTVGQQASGFQMRQVLDESKILIINLPKGKLGEDASSLLGSLLINGIQLAALSRADQPAAQRVPYYLYVDECHSFLSTAFVDILAEARKFGLGFFLAHQYLEQLPEKTKSAVFGNVGTLICFRVGAIDAETLAKEFDPVFNENDLINLPRYSMCLKLMIDMVTAKPFSATTIPIKNIYQSHKDLIMRFSREKFSRTQVESEANNTTHDIAGSDTQQILPF